MSKEDIIANAMKIESMVSQWDCDLLYDLMQQYVTPGGYAMEIGGWKGSSTYVLASVCKEKGATLYEIDTFKGVEDPSSRKNQPGNLGGYFEAASNSNFFHDFMEKNMTGLPVKFLIGDSREMIKQIPDRSLDFAFLDGNHEFPVIDADIKNSIQKMKVGGMLCGHDHGNPDGDVHGAVHRVLNDEFTISVRPVVGDPKYCLTIWQHIIKEEDYARI